MAAHALDWGDSLNRRRRGGKRSTMVMMFVGGSCVVVRGIIDTIPTVRNLRGGSFSFPPEPIGVKLLVDHFFVDLSSPAK